MRDITEKAWFTGNSLPLIKIRNGREVNEGMMEVVVEAKASLFGKNIQVEGILAVTTTLLMAVSYVEEMFLREKLIIERVEVGISEILYWIKGWKVDSLTDESPKETRLHAEPSR